MKVLTIAVVDDRVLNGNVRASVRIPAVGVLSDVYTLTCTRDIYIIEDDIGWIGNEVIVLWREAKHQVADNGIVQAIDTNQYWAQGKDIGCIQIIPIVYVNI